MGGGDALWSVLLLMRLSTTVKEMLLLLIIGVAIIGFLIVMIYVVL
jgi:hypothetical protein